LREILQEELVLEAIDSCVNLASQLRLKNLLQGLQLSWEVLYFNLLFSQLQLQIF